MGDELKIHLLKVAPGLSKADQKAHERRAYLFSIRDYLELVDDLLGNIHKYASKQKSFTKDGNDFRLSIFADDKGFNVKIRLIKDDKVMLSRATKNYVYGRVSGLDLAEEIKAEIEFMNYQYNEQRESASKLSQEERKD